MIPPIVVRDELKSRVLVERYRIADEFVAAVDALWRSFPSGAVVDDAESGRFLDIGQVRPVNYAGTHIRTRGPLNVPGSPQGRPVLVQAGQSAIDQVVRRTEGLQGKVERYHADLAERARSDVDLDEPKRLRERFRVVEHDLVLDAALADVDARHESLRTSFSHGPDGGLQEIHPHATVPLTRTDLSGAGDDERDREISRLRRVNRDTPFDLSAAPLLRAHLVGLAQEPVDPKAPVIRYDLKIFLIQLKSRSDVAMPNN